MACVTCGHTMQRINTRGTTSAWFWCPRCGTIREEVTGAAPDDSVPKLVERCREFEDLWLPLSPDGWKRLGIAEAIHTPDERKESHA